ncbi:hypothetical protein HMPREF3038_03310 [Akkermansia sp. KLE1797]|nr:hypothetical protein HMPREF3038_03310 [Akkermansia sp. KLE1797]KXU55166.1 hypothetical protein HMPREF3039_00628 [Akkermansia sp. KLE1798]KZA03833.1 hypothetical protein HMPREF1326_02485 [Akkermansia sp. KLE1605]
MQGNSLGSRFCRTGERAAPEKRSGPVNGSVVWGRESGQEKPLIPLGW